MKTLSFHARSTQPLPSQTLGTFNGFTVEVCRERSSLNTAFHLRYRAYLAVNAIEENPEELLYDDYDFSPNSRIHLVWKDGKIVGTVRSCIYSDQYDWQPTEAVKYFSKSLQSSFGPKFRLLESNRYAVDPDFQGRQSLFAQMLMFRIHALNAVAHGCEHIMTSVRENHIPFYRRFLGMEPLTDERQYVTWADATVALMATDRQHCYDTALRRGMPAINLEDVAAYIEKAQIQHERRSKTAG